ncbi:hypothetical protein A3D11_04420 [Candidatus Peribacteria bacterium RIFCSPHIGHO2_02_FULL_49_16]|nr:MAG: hypothetical protein A2880_03985 [Candidatus Peribacteria bacterium RIFCSPHIGHO2_01_FULL_49_38]OGJ58947.1 MAG: hypothetical protein A3D11_04420 [Candidatus Peribacteria bacterium RIFCSPHIGHO2_02_FULL_49_16]
MLLRDHLHCSDIPDDLQQVILCLSRIGQAIHTEFQTLETGQAGSTNQFGEEQLKLDVLSDSLIQDHLKKSGVALQCASEEQDDFVELSSDALYTVTYDPLDGSSLVDANFAIGSIFGIYKGKDVLGKTPREQVGAAYVLYGPRTILVYSVGKRVHEFAIDDNGESTMLSENLHITDEAKNYSPGNLRAISDNAAYAAVVQDWLKRTLTLRYSGCMVADVHHILKKGQGIFTNIGGNKYPHGKLRLLYECGPFAYLIEEAGGKTSDGTRSILDIPIEAIDQRTPIIAGSSEEVKHVCEMLKID